MVKCKRCSGEGKYTDYEDTCFAAYSKRCERCGGTGYVEEGGETISYSSGKVPEPDVAKLVREARERAKQANRIVLDHIERIGTWRYRLQTALMSPKDYARQNSFISWLQAYDRDVFKLCDALEERERENAELSARLEHCKQNTVQVAHRLARMKQDSDE